MDIVDGELDLFIAGLLLDVEEVQVLVQQLLVVGLEVHQLLRL